MCMQMPHMATGKTLLGVHISHAWQSTCARLALKRAMSPIWDRRAAAIIAPMLLELRMMSSTYTAKSDEGKHERARAARAARLHTGFATRAYHEPAVVLRALVNSNATGHCLSSGQLSAGLPSRAGGCLANGKRVLEGRIVRCDRAEREVQRRATLRRHDALGEDIQRASFERAWRVCGDDMRARPRCLRGLKFPCAAASLPMGVARAPRRPRARCRAGGSAISRQDAVDRDAQLRSLNPHTYARDATTAPAAITPRRRAPARCDRRRRPSWRRELRSGTAAVRFRARTFGVARADAAGRRGAIRRRRRRREGAFTVARTHGVRLTLAPHGWTAPRAGRSRSPPPTVVSRRRDARQSQPPPRWAPACVARAPGARGATAASATALEVALQRQAAVVAPAARAPMRRLLDACCAGADGGEMRRRARARRRNVSRAGGRARRGGRGAAAQCRRAPPPALLLLTAGTQRPVALAAPAPLRSAAHGGTCGVARVLALVAPVDARRRRRCGRRRH